MTRPTLTVADLEPAGRPGRDPVVLSYGMGVDSTAILLRWLHDPTSRDFDLADLVVVTAMTGDEWSQTGRDVTDHVLPLLRRHRVRFVQVARSRRNVHADGTGVVVLDDSTTPTGVHLAGGYRLSDEMTEAGTIPQTGGARLCSARSKGEPLDATIAALAAGRRYRHVIGFEANETTRAVRDATYDTSVRTGVYPLLEWGWDRVACEEYITAVTGIVWEKSACTFCPFSWGSKAGRERILARFAEHPTEAVAALVMEHIALALNPTQGLVAGARAVDLVRDAGHQHLLNLLTGELESRPHAVYQVSRILRPRKGDPSKMANASRSVRAHAVGSRTQMRHLLAGLGPVTVGPDGIARVYDHHRGASFPTTERFFVVAPVGVRDKQADRFDEWWAALHPGAGDTAQLTLALTA